MLRDDFRWSFGRNSIFDGRNLTDKIASKAVKEILCQATCRPHATGVGFRVKHTRNLTLSCSAMQVYCLLTIFQLFL